MVLVDTTGVSMYSIVNFSCNEIILIECDFNFRRLTPVAYYLCKIKVIVDAISLLLIFGVIIMNFSYDEMT